MDHGIYCSTRVAFSTSLHLTSFLYDILLTKTKKLLKEKNISERKQNVRCEILNVNGLRRSFYLLLRKIFAIMSTKKKDIDKINIIRDLMEKKIGFTSEFIFVSFFSIEILWQIVSI